MESAYFSETEIHDNKCAENSVATARPKQSSPFDSSYGVGPNHCYVTLQNHDFMQNCFYSNFFYLFVMLSYLSGNAQRFSLANSQCSEPFDLRVHIN